MLKNQYPLFLHNSQHKNDTYYSQNIFYVTLLGPPWQIIPGWCTGLNDVGTVEIRCTLSLAYEACEVYNTKHAS